MLPVIGMMIWLYIIRGRIIGADFGTNFPLLALGGLCVVLGGMIAKARKRYLTFRILAGILTAIGVLPDGNRSVLGTSCSLSEAEVHWRAFLESLIERGMHGVRLIVSDDHAGIGAARNALFPGVPWQRCQFHLAQNAMAYVPRMTMRRDVGEDIRTIFNSADREEAERRLTIAVKKYRKSAPKLSEWMEANLPEGFTVFALPW